MGASPLDTLLSFVRCRALSLQASKKTSLVLPGRKFSTTELSTTGHIVDAADSYGAIEVPVTTLDEISNTLQLKKINLIKIDVEGHEYKALLGSKNVLQELRPIVIIELHTPEQDLLVSKFVRNLGYLI